MLHASRRRGRRKIPIAKLLLLGRSGPVCSASVGLGKGLAATRDHPEGSHAFVFSSTGRGELQNCTFYTANSKGKERENPNLSAGCWEGDLCLCRCSPGHQLSLQHLPPHHFTRPGETQALLEHPDARRRAPSSPQRRIETLDCAHAWLRTRFFSCLPHLLPATQADFAKIRLQLSPGGHILQISRPLRWRRAPASWASSACPSSWS